MSKKANKFRLKHNGKYMYLSSEVNLLMQAYADETIDKAIKEIEDVDTGFDWCKGMIHKDVIVSLLQTLKQLEK